MKRIIVLLILIVFLSAGCEDRIEESNFDSEDINLLLNVEGDVKLKRAAWDEFHPASFGTVLHRGDLIQVGDSGEALVLCDSLKSWQVPPGISHGVSNGCPSPAEPALERGESLIGPTRTNVDSLIPYIITPRATLIKDANPLLKWNSVPGAASYNVQIVGDEVIWETKTSKSEIEYPGDPMLVPGEGYLLVVEVENGRTSKDKGAAGLGFQLLTEGDRLALEVGITKIRGLGLTVEAEVYAISQYYFSNELYAEGALMLEEILSGEQVSAAPNRILGDLYLGIGLTRLAEEHYLISYNLAESNNELENQALVAAGLGEVYQALGNDEESIRWLEIAIKQYEGLGDIQQVERLQDN